MKMTKANLFLGGCLAFIAGVGIHSFVSLSRAVSGGLICAGVVILIIVWPRRKLIMYGLVLLGGGLGFLRATMAVPSVSESDIQYYNNQTVSVYGLISGEPDVRKDHVKLTISAQRMVRDTLSDIKGKILVNASLYPRYHYGDAVLLTCPLRAPEAIIDEESGRIFRYDEYLSRFNIYSLCYRPQLTLVGSRQGSSIMRGLLAAKARFVRTVQMVLPEPQASFLGGLILGAKRAIPDDLMEAFGRTGTTHIVALSGYNITIIALLVMNLCRHLWISRRGAFWVSLASITFFVLITGASASVVRAGIMGMLVLLAARLGRASRITNTLVLAAVIMLAINPKVLVFDAGFQLSFLATIGLVFVSPIVERWFQWVPRLFEIRSSLVATLSATIMTLPLIVFQFGRLSLVAPLVNVLILPAIPLAMGTGFIMGILSLFWLPLGQVFGWLVWVVLSYIIFIVERFSRLSFASFDTGLVSGWWLAIGYGILSATVVLLQKIIIKHPRREGIL